MNGTLINCALIAAGGLIGTFVGRGLNERLKNALMKSLGVAVLIIGFNGVISNMFTVRDGALSGGGEMLMVLSLVIGTAIGTLLGIDEGIEKLSASLENKMRLSGFARGFSSATILFCVGAMAIVGSINDGLRGDSSVLITKGLLDFTAGMVLASTLGAGVVFSAVSVFLYQGTITLLAGTLSGLLAGELLSRFCAVGYAIIICIGLNFLLRDKIKTANMLPSLLVPVAWHFIEPLF